MSYFKLNRKEITNYKKDGYIIVRGFLSKEEVAKLSKTAFGDENIKNHAFELNDKTGKKTRLTEWYNPQNDIYGMLARSKRMIESVDKLMDGDGKVCHFHSKLMQKQPKVGGAWEWHQDYGYWYKNEFLFPDQMISVMIAITDATKENGCLQVIKGSHKMGRVEHGLSGEQTGASEHYVDLALKTMDLVYVELKAGDALLFHSNLLHRSNANLSNKPRWSLISCYNRSSNAPYNESSKSSTVPLKMVPDEAMLEWELHDINEAADFAK
ncbi:MAG: phytanoyl-CoA dioxygenase family protein [Chitinophagaceae bacterium]|nr:MAG: phytanoyl-CoA dioxygenase family protein [Chitinophagaceae bacterium]